MRCARVLVCSSYFPFYSNGIVPFVFRANDLILLC